MGKGKLAKFADMERYENVFQYPFSVADNVPFDMKGHWRDLRGIQYGTEEDKHGWTTVVIE